MEEEEIPWKVEAFQALRAEFEKRFQADPLKATLVRHGGTRLVEHVNVTGLPRLGGSYHASIGNGYIHCSAVVGLELPQESDLLEEALHAPELVKGGIQGETYRCCQLIEQVLYGCSAKWADLVRITAFVPGLVDAKVEAFEKSFDHFCSEHGCPQAARTVVGCAGLRLQAAVQIEAIAVSNFRKESGAEDASCSTSRCPLDMFPTIISASEPSVIPPVSPPPGLQKLEEDATESQRTSCATTAGSTPNVKATFTSCARSSDESPLSALLTPSMGPSPELGPVRGPGADARNAQNRTSVEAMQQPFPSLNLAPGAPVRGFGGAPAEDRSTGSVSALRTGTSSVAVQSTQAPGTAAPGAACSSPNVLNLEAMLNRQGQEDAAVLDRTLEEEDDVRGAAAALPTEASQSWDKEYRRVAEKTIAEMRVRDGQEKAKTTKSKVKARGKQAEVPKAGAVMPKQHGHATPLNPGASRFLPAPALGTAAASLVAAPPTGLVQAAPATLSIATAEPSPSAHVEAMPQEAMASAATPVAWSQATLAAAAPMGKRGKAKAKSKAKTSKLDDQNGVEPNQLQSPSEPTLEPVTQAWPSAGSEASPEGAAAQRSPLVGQLACLCLEEVPADEAKRFQVSNGDLQMSRWRARMTGHDVYRTVRLGPGSLLCAQLEQSWARRARGPWPVVWSYNFDIIITKTLNSFVNIGFVEWIGAKDREVPEICLQDRSREMSLAELTGLPPGDDWSSGPNWQHLSENPRQMMLGCRKGVKWYGNNYSEPLFKNDICEGTHLHFQCDNVFDQSGKLIQVQMWLLPSSVVFRSRTQVVELAKPMFEWPSNMLWEKDYKGEQECAMWVPAVTLFSKDDSVTFAWRGARPSSSRGMNSRPEASTEMSSEQLNIVAEAQI